MRFSESIFAVRFGITRQDLENYLGEALSQGGDYADLYFEYLVTSSIGIDESMVKSAAQGVSMGVGVRVIAGERTGYAYSDDLAPVKIRKAANVAAHIAAAPAKVAKFDLNEGRKHNLYPVLTAPTETAFSERVDLVKRADRAARAFDPRIFQVQAVYADNLRQVLVATSEGRLSVDRQPLARLSVSVLARQSGGPPQRGHAGGGGRMDLDYFLQEKTPEHFAHQAAREAIAMLDAVEAPAGEMTVVLGPGWPGILLHEAVGHGLEADFNRKGVSAFSGRMGQKVASELCTVVDDGTIGRLRGAESTGSGRRESYAHILMPRMTNTFMMAGESDPEEIVRSVPKGLYCVNFGGGQVDITSGNFVFSASESYLIEDGKLTRPVRNATLIGNGPEALKYVSMVGNDLRLDEGIGTCGKDGQSVPVGVGIPTIKIDKMTVGGTA